MPAAIHQVFPPPENFNAAIWRYMDFTKFVSTLESKALYFARYDTLGDPFEGSLPLATWNRYQELVNSLNATIPESPNGKFPWAERFSSYNKNCYINCWHLNDFESAAMWKLYAQTREAIAIKTTYWRLSRVFYDSVTLGLVQYIDFDTADLASKGPFYSDRFMHKRLSFAHEREVRAIRWNRVGGDAGPEYEAPMGIPVPVDLEELIESVYVAPTCPNWFFALVRQVVARYQLDVPVVQSALDKAPMF